MPPPRVNNNIAFLRRYPARVTWPRKELDKLKRLVRSIRIDDASNWLEIQRLLGSRNRITWQELREAAISHGCFNPTTDAVVETPIVETQQSIPVTQNQLSENAETNTEIRDEGMATRMGISPTPTSQGVEYTSQQIISVLCTLHVKVVKWWYFVTVNNHIAIEGLFFNSVKNSMEKMTSKPIVLRICSIFVVDEEGMGYQLIGAMDNACAIANGLLPEAIELFRTGLPEDWKYVLARYFIGTSVTMSPTSAFTTTSNEYVQNPYRTPGTNLTPLMDSRDFMEVRRFELVTPASVSIYGPSTSTQ